jgi:acetolactate decarboxylase
MNKPIYNSQFYLSLFFLVTSLLHGACNQSKPKEKAVNKAVHVVSAMKNVMWKGELGPKIKLDTLSQREHLYGLGPLSGLRGEILINNDKCFVSKVNTANSMEVNETFQASAPFFVYAYQSDWQEIPLDDQLNNIAELERYLKAHYDTIGNPFVFKLKGFIESGIIHVQNLAPGTKVSKPEEAHQGQVNFLLRNELAEIIGFYSEAHHGIFTHHDSNVHLHLITQDESKMGHLDDVNMLKMTLYLPKE